MKRFNEDDEKLDNCVEFSQQIDLTEFTFNKASARFELNAFSQHYGGTHGGHYTAMAARNGTFYSCDDSSVSKGTVDYKDASAYFFSYGFI